MTTFFETGKHYVGPYGWSIPFQTPGKEKVEVLAVAENSRGFSFAFVRLTMDGRTDDKLAMLDQWNWDNHDYWEMVEAEAGDYRCGCSCCEG